MTAENTASKQRARGRAFQKGTSGNPAGKPKGARHRTTQAIESLMAGEGERLGRKAIELALAGDITALRLCLDRVAPVPRDRAIKIEVPTVKTVADLVQATGSLLEAVCAGEISPGEAAEVGRLIEAYRAVVETAELEARISRLEEERGEGTNDET